MGLQLVPTLGSSLCWLLGRQAELEISFPEVPQTDSHSRDGGLPFTDSKDSSLTALAAWWQLLASLFLLTPGLGTQLEPHQSPTPTPRSYFLISACLFSHQRRGRRDSKPWDLRSSLLRLAVYLFQSEELFRSLGGGGRWQALTGQLLPSWVSPPTQDTLA